MRRWRRILILVAIVAAAIVVPAWSLRNPPGAARSRLRAKFPTTQFSDHSTGSLFTIDGLSAFIIVPELATWRTTLNSRYQMTASGSVTRGDGMIFVPDSANGIRVIDELSRAVIRTIPLPVPVRDLFWADGGTVIASAAAGLYGLDPVNGTILWSTEIVNGAIEAGLAGQRGLVYFGTTISGNDGAVPALIALDVRSGKRIWQAPLPHRLHGAPAIDGDTLFCGSRDIGHPFGQSVTAFDAATGQRKWDRICDHFAS